MTRHILRVSPEDYTRALRRRRMGRYHLYNRVTKEDVTIEGASAQEACESQGWLIGDCHVIELPPNPPGVGVRPSAPQSGNLPGKMGIRRTEMKGFKD